MERKAMTESQWSCAVKAIAKAFRIFDHRQLGNVRRHVEAGHPILVSRTRVVSNGVAAIELIAVGYGDPSVLRNIRFDFDLPREFFDDAIELLAAMSRESRWCLDAMEIVGPNGIREAAMVAHPLDAATVTWG